MPIPRIVLTASQRDDLAITCSVGAEKLAKIATRIEALDETIQRRTIDAAIRDEIGENAGAVVSRFLFSVAGPLRREASTSDEILSGIEAAIQRYLPDDRRFKDWSACQPVLSRLLHLPSVTLAAKALDISYDFERVYAGGRFLTSVRPVYNERKDDIVGVTIVHTLRLDYSSANGDETSVSIAIDIEDIRRLQVACQEALDKAKVAQEKFHNKYGLETIMPRTSDFLA